MVAASSWGAENPMVAVYVPAESEVSVTKVSVLSDVLEKAPSNPPVFFPSLEKLILKETI